MKTFPLIVKYVFVPIGTLAGLFFAFDGYIVDRARTAVKPTEVKVQAIEKNVEEITIRTRNIEKILMERK